jgi:hypothetical protein
MMSLLLLVEYGANLGNEGNLMNCICVASKEATKAVVMGKWE